MGTNVNLPGLFSKVRHEVKIFSNMICILGKIEQDGFFESISLTFEKIIESEMVYAVNGNYPSLDPPSALFLEFVNLTPLELKKM